MPLQTYCLQILVRPIHSLPSKAEPPQSAQPDKIVTNPQAYHQKPDPNPMTSTQKSHLGLPNPCPRHKTCNLSHTSPNRHLIQPAYLDPRRQSIHQISSTITNITHPSSSTRSKAPLTSSQPTYLLEIVLYHTSDPIISRISSVVSRMTFFTVTQRHRSRLRVGCRTLHLLDV